MSYLSQYPTPRYDHTCPGCQGYGALPCGRCEGTGHLEAHQPSVAAATENAGPACPDCHASGAIRCVVCHGKGLRGSVAANRFV